MNNLEKKLKELDSGLLANLHSTIETIDSLLLKYDTNFIEYTDHSVKHTKEVFNIASQLLNEEEIDNLNSDEIYVLSMACILHDVGMCIPKEKIDLINESDKYKIIRESNPSQKIVDFLRDIHHELSYDFIMSEWTTLNVPNEKYAEAIALVAKGHRKVALEDVDVYQPKFYVKSGRDFVCLPYLASVIRLADELDVTNIRTPEILTKYYMPKNEFSLREWKKHISTTLINYSDDTVIFEVKCSDHNNYSALQEQFEKIQNQSNYCQKIIRTISNTGKRKFSLEIQKVDVKYKFIGFDPKGIKFSFNVKNVIETFIGKDLYNDDLVCLREALQNAIDSCLYKSRLLENNYQPKIKLEFTEESIIINDNGLGMDKFIIENFFGKLGSSFYTQKEVKDKFEAIGQFGVGVFSYFLLADYIDIETKTKNSDALKFRIDKNPNSYFHFYDTPKKSTTGTKITINIKKEYQKKHSHADYLRYIKRLFKYIDFPIIIKSPTGQSILKKHTFKLNQNIVLDKFIELKHKEKTNKIQILTHSIKNDEYEGECALLFMLNDKNVNSVRDYIDYSEMRKGLYLYQKGIFVNNKYPENYDGMNNFTGNINIKQPKKISIDRTEFTNSDEINPIIFKFQEALAKKLLNMIDKKNRVESTFNFVYDYLPYTDNLKLITKLKKYLFFKIYKSKVEIIDLQEIISKQKSFVLMTNKEISNKEHKKFKTPAIEINNYGYMGCHIMFVKLYAKELNLSLEAITNKEKTFIKLIKKENLVDKNTLKKLKTIFQYGSFFCESKSNKFMFDMNVKRQIESFSEERFYNLTHPLIVSIIEKIDALNKNHECLRHINSIIRIMSGYSFSKTDLDTINKLMLPLKNIGIVWKFSDSDFYFD